MPNFYMLIGIAGVGKSTWAENHKTEYNYEILSSDKIREEVFGDVNDQSHNAQVFTLLHNKVIEYLKAGKNVCYDATNLNRKDRRGILSAVNSISTVDVIGVLFLAPLDIIKDRNKSRSRVVPEHVLDYMQKKFEMPFYGEGFTKLWKVEDYSGDRLSYSSAIASMEGFDQRNPHHSLTLKEHCDKCVEEFVKSLTLSDTRDDNIDDVVTAASLHDYGKLFTATEDDNDDTYHYYHHENVGAYKILTELSFPPSVNKYKVAFYVNYHMEPYRLSNAKDSKLEYYKKLFDNEWKYIQMLHKADEAAH